MFKEIQNRYGGSLIGTSNLDITKPTDKPIDYYPKKFERQDTT